MKNVVFAIMMCVVAMSTKAQVITSKIVNNVYETVCNQTDGDFAFNAEMTGNDITTMFVYKIVRGNKGMETLKPFLKYDYSYTADGTLTSRVASRWMDGQNEWTYVLRYDYTLDNDKYLVEYSRYNHAANRFEQPVDKMVYSLVLDDCVNYVSCYHRDSPTSLFQLVSEMPVTGQPALLAEK
jgi:hypothetical protein